MASLIQRWEGSLCKQQCTDCVLNGRTQAWPPFPQDQIKCTCKPRRSAPVRPETPSQSPTRHMIIARRTHLPEFLRNISHSGCEHLIQWPLKWTGAFHHAALITFPLLLRLISSTPARRPSPTRPRGPGSTVAAETSGLERTARGPRQAGPGRQRQAREDKDG